MTPKKNPTLSDVYKKLDNMDTRLDTVEKWQSTEDITRKAISNYRKDEQQTTKSKQVAQLLRDLSPLIIALTVLVYALTTKAGK